MSKNDERKKNILCVSSTIYKILILEIIRVLRTSVAYSSRTVTAFTNGPAKFYRFSLLNIFHILYEIFEEDGKRNEKYDVSLDSFNKIAS